MALTAYCKKCAREVEPGETCLYCGSRLGKTSAHAAWCIERVPVKDWMCWNAVMRLLLPLGLVILLLVVLLEAISGGAAAVEALLASSFPAVLLILLGTVLALVFLALLLQGRELADFVVDNRGIHEKRYLTNPTPLRLLVRLKPPALAKQAEPNGSVRVLKLGEKDLPWKNVSRVQLWPEKCMILYYAPAWWLRSAVVCTPFTWDDVMGLTREKIGKKRSVKLPPALVVHTEPKARRARSQHEEPAEQIRMEDLIPDIPPEEAPEVPPEETPPEE